MTRILMLTVVIFALGGGVATAGKLITSKQIKNGSISTVDLSSSAKRSLRGNEGPQGPQGPAGGAGGTTFSDVSATMVLNPGDIDGPDAYCPAGTTVIGTGFFASITHVAFVKAYGSFAGSVFHNETSIPIEVEVQALCGSTGTATRTSLSATGRSEYAKDRRAAGATG